jgi:RNA polymerase sigma factor (sigma-70 family)
MTVLKQNSLLSKDPDEKDPSVLLARLKDRDIVAQQELLKEHDGWIMAICVKQLGDRELARECTQDIFHDFLIKYVDNIRDARAIPAYLRMMAVHRTQRLKIFRQKHQSFEEQIGDACQETEESQRVEAVDREIFLHRLHNCLHKLTDKARKVVKLHYYQELTMAQTGERMGVSRQYVSKVITKGLTVLKRCMGVFQHGS